MAPDAARDGGCLCRAVRYRVAGDPVWSNLCYCRTCCRATGAPAVAFARFRRDRFALLSGRPARYASSPAVERSFCATCGSSLFVEGRHLGPDIVVAVATLDDPAAVPATMCVHTGSRIPWMPPLPGLPAWSGHDDEPKP